MGEQQTSHSLLSQLKAAPQDSPAWDRFQTIYESWLKQKLRWNGAKADDVDDLFQEVMVVVVRRLPTFEHNQRKGAFRNWLRVIACNCLRDLQKKTTLRESDSEGIAVLLMNLEDPSSDVSVQWDREHDHQVLRGLLVHVRQVRSQRDFTIFERVALQGDSSAQVAEDLNVKAGTVRQVVHRIYEELKNEAAGMVDEKK